MAPIWLHSAQGFYWIYLMIRQFSQFGYHTISSVSLKGVHVDPLALWQTLLFSPAGLSSALPSSLAQLPAPGRYHSSFFHGDAATSLPRLPAKGRDFWPPFLPPRASCKASCYLLPCYPRNQRTDSLLPGGPPSPITCPNSLGNYVAQR